MKIKQELIDKLVNSSWTREKLAEEILIARFYSKHHQLEAWWLDQLADMLRDGEGGEEQDRIYKEYQDEVTANRDRYKERKNES